MKKVVIIMGSNSDYSIMKESEIILKELGVPTDKFVVSAHRTPDMMYKFAKEAHTKYEIIIAGAGGAAHLPGMVASLTNLPVIGVPIETKALKGMDSLLSIAQMPYGVPVATMAIGVAGAKNAGLMAARMLATHDLKINKKLTQFKTKQIKKVKNMELV